jgi:hypothetical protein
MKLFNTKIDPNNTCPMCKTNLLHSGFDEQICQNCGMYRITSFEDNTFIIEEYNIDHHNIVLDIDNLIIKRGNMVLYTHSRIIRFKDDSIDYFNSTKECRDYIEKKLILF